MPKPEMPQRVPLPAWIAAALGAAALHAGLLAATLHYRQPAEDEEALGAPAIEIGIELASPRVEPTNLPAGPDAAAAAAAPAVVEQKAVVDSTDLPKAVPTETDDPDRLVTAQDPQKPREDDPHRAAVQAMPSEESVASVETAPPSIPTAVEAPRSVAPALGTGDSAQRQRATWQKELAAHFDKNKRYPSDRSSQSAEIVVRFVLDRTGHILASEITQGSGDASFDEAALAMLRRADPVPPPPPLVADGGLSFTLPLIFRAKGAEHGGR
jgi:protein TonB